MCNCLSHVTKECVSIGRNAVMVYSLRNCWLCLHLNRRAQSIHHPCCQFTIHAANSPTMQPIHQPCNRFSIHATDSLSIQPIHHPCNRFTTHATNWLSMQSIHYPCNRFSIHATDSLSTLHIFHCFFPITPKIRASDKNGFQIRIRYRKIRRIKEKKNILFYMTLNDNNTKFYVIINKLFKYDKHCHRFQ